MSVTVFHECEIPQYVETELDRLHGSLYASLRHLRVVGLDSGAHTYVRRLEDETACVLIYRVEGEAVQVLTQVLDLSAEELNHFADFIFERHAQVKTITLPAVSVERTTLGRPHYARLYKYDVVSDVPATPDLFNKQLGKSVRRELRRSADRLAKDHPDLEITFEDGADCSETDVREILALSRERIESKTETWAYSGSETDNIVTFLRQGGFVCIARIGGKVCGGQICYRFGDHFTLKACGYDTRYSAYSLGFLLCYQGMLECIRRGAKRIFLGFIVYDYKLWLKGKPRRLDRVVLYRSRAQQLARVPAIAVDFIAFHKEELLARARKASHAKGRLAQSLRVLRSMLRVAKRAGRLLRPGWR